MTRQNFLGKRGKNYSFRKIIVSSTVLKENEVILPNYPQKSKFVDRNIDGYRFIPRLRKQIECL